MIAEELTYNVSKFKPFLFFIEAKKVYIETMEYNIAAVEIGVYIENVYHFFIYSNEYLYKVEQLNKKYANTELTIGTKGKKSNKSVYQAIHVKLVNYLKHGINSL